MYRSNKVFFFVRLPNELTFVPSSVCSLVQKKGVTYVSDFSNLKTKKKGDTVRRKRVSKPRYHKNEVIIVKQKN